MTIMQSNLHMTQFFVYCKIYFAICMYIVDFFKWVHIASRYIYGWGTLCTKEHFILRNILLLKSWTHLTAQHTWQSHNLLHSTPCSLTHFATQNPLLLITPCCLTPFATQNPLLLITPCSSTLFASQHPLLPGALYYSTHFALWTEMEIIPFIHFYPLG